MTIKTYGLSFMSRWQSALNAALQQGESESANLSAGTPAMKASCKACETLEAALKDGKDGVDLAEVVTKGELLTNCAHMYIALAAAKFTGNTQRARVTEATIEMYSKFLCPYCSRAKRTLNALGVSYKSIEITFSPSRRAEMIQRSGRISVPQIFIDDHHVGGSDDLEIAKDNGQLNKLLAGV